MIFTVELPVPPSTNRLYLKGRIKTDKYRSWRKNAILAIYAQVPTAKRITGKVQVGIFLPRKCRLDCDNTAKATLDALVDSQRIDDDRNVMSVHIQKSYDSAKMLVVVEDWTT